MGLRAQRLSGLIALLVLFTVVLVMGVSAGSPLRMYLPTIYQPPPTPTPSPIPTELPATPIPPPAWSPPGNELRAVWVSRYDWTTYGKTPTSGDIQAVVNDAVRGGFNAVFFQVRGAGDAYYAPGLEPWAGRLTGTISDSIGTNPGWDPLAFMLQSAHAAGLQVHAWINVYPAYQAPPAGIEQDMSPPYGICPPAPFWRFSWSNAGCGEGSGYGLTYWWRVYSQGPNGPEPMPIVPGEYLWASPNCPQWRAYVVEVAKDIVARYGVDGLHLDNVRFPGVQYSLDPFLMAACEADPSCPSVYDDAWRGAYQREQVTALVDEITTEVHKIRPGIMVSASVMPVYVDRWGWGNTNQAYSDYYQDSQYWLRAGKIDAVAPMLYTNTFYLVSDWGKGTYTFRLDRWRLAAEDFATVAGPGRAIPGIGVTYLNKCVPFGDIQAQIEAARSLEAGGQALFSLGALRSCGYLDPLRSGPYSPG